MKGSLRNERSSTDGVLYTMSIIGRIDLPKSVVRNSEGRSGGPVLSSAKSSVISSSDL